MHTHETLVLIVFALLLQLVDIEHANISHDSKEMSNVTECQRVLLCV